MSKIYTDNELLNELKRFYKNTGKIPSSRDFIHNKNYPGSATYIHRFKTWNNALKLAGLPINKIAKLPNNVRCEICKTKITKGGWYYKNGKRICSKCYGCGRNYLHGTLDPNSNTGMGVLTEYVVYVMLGDCTKCNTKDSFHSDYDLISERYGTINVKSSKLCEQSENSYGWNFQIKSDSKNSNYYICIGFDKYKIQILHVWIIQNNSNLINSVGIKITNSKNGLKRAQQCEVDPTPYNEVYQNLDVTTLPEFRNINNNSLETEAI